MDNYNNTENINTNPVILPMPAQNPSYGALRGFGAVVLCIALFWSVCAAVFISAARSSLTVEAIMHNVSEISISEIIEEFDIADAIYDSINDVISENFDLVLDDVMELIESPEVEEFFSDMLTNLVGSLLTDGDEFGFSNEDILDFIKENEELIEETLGYTITEEDYGEIEDFFVENDVFENLAVIELPEELRAGADFVQRGVSAYINSIFITAVVLSVLFALLLFAVNIKRYRAFFLQAGIVGVLAGGFYVFLGVSLSGIIVSFAGALIPAFLVNSMLSFIMSRFLAAGVVITALGAASLILYIIWRILASRKSAVV